MPVTKQINLDRQGAPEFIQEVDKLWRDVRRQLVSHVDKQASVTFRRDGTGLLFNVLIPEPPKESPKPPAEAKAETPDPAGAVQTPDAAELKEPAKAAEPRSVQPKRRKRTPKPTKPDNENADPAQ